jgi:hypothetical protein
MTSEEYNLLTDICNRVDKLEDVEVGRYKLNIIREMN